MSIYTARDIIYGALRLIGQLAEGEVPSAQTAQDSLTAMNQMIDSWSIQSLKTHSTQDQTFNWPTNTRTITFGPTGDIVGNRPVQVLDSTYFITKNTTPNISYSIQLVNDDQYNNIIAKTLASSLPQILWVNYTYPNITMYIYPVPTQLVEFHLISVQELSQPANLSTELSFPPGYMKAFRYNLAIELASEFGVEPSSAVIVNANKSLAALMRINNPQDMLCYPYELTQNRSRYNIYTDSSL